MKKEVILFIIYAILLTACKEYSITLPSNADKKMVVIHDKTYTPMKEYSFITGNYGNYKRYLEQSDYVLSISSTKPSPIENVVIEGFMYPTNNPFDKDRVCDSRYEVRLNDSIRISKTSTKTLQKDLSEEAFGRTVSFQINHLAHTKVESNLEAESAEVEMYVPKEIVLLSPVVTNSEELYPLCYYENFIIRWNEDPNNLNGIIAVIDWYGETIIGKNIPNTNVRRFCIFPDTGSAIFDTRIFEGIPDTAVCHMTLLRGNIELLQVCDESIKILAESHEFLTFVLIRELSN